MKKIVAFILACIIALGMCSVVCAGDDTITMYAADGRVVEIPENKVEAYKFHGWYTEPMATVYAMDGRTLLIKVSEIEMYEKVGWYRTEPEKIMYAADGRTLMVPISEIEAHKAVGWFLAPPVTVYAADGRTLQIANTEIEAYKAVGWYTEPMKTMYAADGRTLVVPKYEEEAYQAVGWYSYPVTTVYAPGGRSLLIYQSEVEAYKGVGWYTDPMRAKYNFYEEINVPTYDSVTGAKHFKTNDRYYYYRYTGSDDFLQYKDVLYACGWKIYTYDTKYEWKIIGNTLKKVPKTFRTVYEKDNMMLYIRENRSGGGTTYDEVIISWTIR